MIKKNITVLILCFWAYGLPAQAGFISDFLQSNPLHPDSSYTFEEKIEAYKIFLEDGKKQNNKLQQIFAYLHLEVAYTNIQQSSEGFEYILKAEQIAVEAQNDFWLAGVNYEKASVYAYIQDFKSALPFFEESLVYSKTAKDSQMIAINLEQMGAMHNYLENRDTAFAYYERAIPLIKKHCSRRSLGVTLSNYGILLLEDEKPKEAILHFEEAIEAAREVKDKFREMAFTSNLASAYFDDGKIDKALELWEKCVDVNQEYGWEDLLIRNYEGVSEIHEKRGDFKNSLFYYKESHNLQDSIMGRDVQKKIATLEKKYENQKKELALQKNKLQLKETRQILERTLGGLLFLILLGAFGIWKWRLQTQNTKILLNQNRENLRGITQLLKKKNVQLENMEQQLFKETVVVKEENQQKPHAAMEEDAHEHLYNQRILTTSDWQLFKANFEKSYPGYLLQLRTKYPKLTESEERLFLFLKLQLTTKEIAEILGISIGGVKKTRYRLRKKLNLESDDSLEGLVRAF